ncbi:MAG: aminopeptidase N [Legionellaceae bacterium]|nr:aminopeptidase N [Legionellaceae bacterium]
MTHTTTYLADYKPTHFALITVHLDFDLHDDYVLVSNQMLLQRRHAGELRLYGDELELVSIQLNDHLLSREAYRFDGQDLVMDDCPDDVRLTIVTRLYPQNNTQLSGLYRSNTMFCTQCEAQGFRRITYFYDRPDVLAKYTTRISANKEQYPILLSNGNLLGSGENGNDRHWAIWQDPFKKPSYLFALVAGNLECVRDEFITCSGKRVDLHIYVEPGEVDKCAHAMVSLKKAMKWDEDEYGREYDLSIFMIVAVSDFNMGAMENKGLNIFNSKYILARPDTATDADYAGIESVVAHEYFHNWTGNRVTCRDWFQLSLKEGLTVFRDQEFSRDMNSRDVNRILDVKALRSIQFPEDAGRMAHPVRPESYQEISNFYTATIYNKGAEVIRMQRTLLGKEGFRRGMDLYFKRHDGEAVTIDDFVTAMEDANGVDFTQFKRWYSQAGTPSVQVQSTFNKGRLTLCLTQTCPVTPECDNKKPFHIPIQIALFNAKGQAIPLDNEILELTKSEQTFHFDDLEDEPIVSLLRGFSAPISLHTTASQERLLALLRYETDGFAKWDAAQNLAMTSLLESYHAAAHTWQMPSALLDAYEHVLMDDGLDPALRAELLTPPNFEDMANALTDVDVERVEDARDLFRKELGSGLYDKARALYELLWRQEDHARHGAAYGLRKLRHVCLRLMMRADESGSMSLCQEQFAQAKTMTDQIASLTLLANCSDETVRQHALDTFYQQWKKDDLVLDKWFTVQAAADLPDVLSRVKALLKHSAFNLKNPNKVRSLVVAFCQLNPRYFHAIDGSGYRFLTDMLMTIDKTNSQLSARLATPFTRWQRLDKTRQVLIKEELKRLSAMDLSNDLSELVTKSMQ